MDGEVRITLPDGSTKQVASGTRVIDFVRDSIGPGLAKAAVPRSRRPARSTSRASSTATRSSRSSPRRRPRGSRSSATTRRTSSRGGAAAVPGTQVTIGPAIENGFYYDFDSRPAVHRGRPARSRGGVAKIVAEDAPFERAWSRPDEAIALFTGKGETFKVEIIGHAARRGRDLAACTATATGSTSARARTARRPAGSAIKLLSSPAPTGAAITATRSCSASTAPPSSTRRSSTRSSSSARRRRSATTAGSARSSTCSTSIPTRPGAAFWTPKGTASTRCCRRTCASSRCGTATSEIKTPLLFNKGLWEISGHWGKYKENMFLVLDSEAGRARLLAQADELPVAPPVLRIEEALATATCRCACTPRTCCTATSRRARSAGSRACASSRRTTRTSTDARSQIPDEVQRFVDAARPRLQRVRPDLHGQVRDAARRQRIGDDAMWDRAEAALHGGARRPSGSPYELKPGDGAFYGPKIDFDVSDAHRPQVAARHHPARLRGARALRPDLRRRGRQGAPAGRDPPRDLRLASSASSRS